MGIDIVFMGWPKSLGIDDPTYGCFSARSMMEYLPDDLCPMMHLSSSQRGACPRRLRDYVELLRDFTRGNDPARDLKHPQRAHGVHALRQFIRTAKQYLQCDVGAYVSY